MRRLMAYSGAAVAGFGGVLLATAVIGSAPTSAYLGVFLVLVGLMFLTRGLLLPTRDRDSQAPWIPDFEVGQEDDYRPKRAKAPPGTLEVGQPRAPKIPPPGREP